MPAGSALPSIVTGSVNVMVVFYIRARAPNLSVGNEVAPNLAVLDQRPMIGDGDVSDADALPDDRALALPRQVENKSLRQAKARERC